MSNDSNGGAYGSESSRGVLPPDVGQKAKAEFDSVVDTARGDLDAIRQKAADDVGKLTDQAKDQLHAASDKAKSFAGEQKDLAAGQLGGISAAISKVADELDGNDQGAIARYARDLAKGLEKMSGRVKDNNVDDLVGMAQDFGRSQPVAFLGAAALAGFVASRFALASTHRREAAGVKMPGSFSGDQSNNYRPETSKAYPAASPGNDAGNKEGNNVRS